MNLNTLNEFRHAVYRSFCRARDALFNVCDALVTLESARSFAELSLSPCVPRRWPSLYAALRDGQIDRSQLQQVFAQSAPGPTAGQRLVLGVDATNIARPESPTARDRIYVYVHNLPECKAPVTVGWSFSTLAVLPESPSSWTYVLDNARIPSDQSAGAMAAAQLVAVLPQLSARALLTGDRYYGSAKFVQATATADCDKLLRIPGNRVFYHAAPPRTGRRGAPKKDGAVFKCHDPATHGDPPATWISQDEHGQQIEVAAWAGLHYKRCRPVTLTVIRVTRHGASGQKRDPRVSWFIWIGQAPIPLSEVWPTYRRRFSLEHGFRFDKQDLLWPEPRFRTPEQFQRWTDVVAIAHNQLVLARDLADAQRQPWESQKRPATPRQVRRAMPRIVAQLGTPALTPQLRGKSAGRARGTKVTRATRYSVVCKSAVKPQVKRHRNF
jgi:DDE superfamily endonuclease